MRGREFPEGRDGAVKPSEVARRALAEHGLASDGLEPLGAGLDNTAFLAGGLVVRVGAAAEREAVLLAALPEEIPAPRPVFAAEGCMAYPKLPGTPLLDLPRDRDAAAIGAELGRLMALLTTLPAELPAEVRAQVPEDDDPPAAWLEDLIPDYAPFHLQPLIEGFLATPAPDPPERRTLCHTDLGAEHVLVDPATGEVTGILDWTDASVTDPARDLGKILRDLGDPGLAAALAAFAEPVDAGRILFHARCAALEDLAFGMETGRSSYSAAALSALPRLFPAV